MDMRSWQDKRDFETRVVEEAIWECVLAHSSDRPAKILVVSMMMRESDCTVALIHRGAADLEERLKYLSLICIRAEFPKCLRRYLREWVVMGDRPWFFDEAIERLDSKTLFRVVRLGNVRVHLVRSRLAPFLTHAHDALIYSPTVISPTVLKEHGVLKDDCYVREIIPPLDQR